MAGKSTSYTAVSTEGRPCSDYQHQQRGQEKENVDAENAAYASQTLSEMVASCTRKPSGQGFRLLASERPPASSGPATRGPQEEPERQRTPPVYGAFSSHPRPSSITNSA